MYRRQRIRLRPLISRLATSRPLDREVLLHSCTYERTSSTSTFNRGGTRAIVVEIVLPSFISMAFVASQLNKLRNQLHINQTKGAVQSFLFLISGLYCETGIRTNWVVLQSEKVRNRTMHCKQTKIYCGNGMGTQIN